MYRTRTGATRQPWPIHRPDRTFADSEFACDDRPPPAQNGQRIMANKDSQKANTKKVGKTLKEKRSAKRAKAADKTASHIPPTNH
jgi:hypothetical protein